MTNYIFFFCISFFAYAALLTKNKPVTDEDKQWNKVISIIRVPVEHAIGGMKRYQAVTQTFRNKKVELTDTFMLLAAGL